MAQRQTQSQHIHIFSFQVSALVAKLFTSVVLLGLLFAVGPVVVPSSIQCRVGGLLYTALTAPLPITAHPAADQAAIVAAQVQEMSRHTCALYTALRGHADAFERWPEALKEWPESQDKGSILRVEEYDRVLTDFVSAVGILSPLCPDTVNDVVLNCSSPSTFNNPTGPLKAAASIFAIDIAARLTHTVRALHKSYFPSLFAFSPRATRHRDALLCAFHAETAYQTARTQHSGHTLLRRATRAVEAYQTALARENALFHVATYRPNRASETDAVYVSLSEILAREYPRTHDAMTQLGLGVGLAADGFAAQVSAQLRALRVLTGQWVTRWELIEWVAREGMRTYCHGGPGGGLDGVEESTMQDKQRREVLRRRLHRAAVGGIGGDVEGLVARVSEWSGWSGWREEEIMLWVVRAVFGEQEWWKDEECPTSNAE